MFWHKVVTVVALGLLSLGMYATFHEGGQIVDSASAKTADQPRRRAERATDLTLNKSVHTDFMKSDTTTQELEVSGPGGQKLKLTITNYWVASDLKSDHSVSYVIEDDTLNFLSYTEIRIGNAKPVTINRKQYDRVIRNLSAYMLQSTRFVGYASGAYWFEQVLGLPNGAAWSAGFVGIAPSGAIIHTGKSGLCDGGVQISPDGSQLLNCKGILNLANRKQTPFEELQIAATKYLNDTLYVVIEDNIDQYNTNARLMHTRGDTLFTFMYHGYQREDRYQSGISTTAKHLVFFDPNVREVILFEKDKLDEPQLISLNRLKQYETLQESKTHLNYTFEGYATAALYLDEKGLPYGYTLD